MSSFKRKILFRVDASNQLGLGHIIRCAALSQMLTDHFAIHFAVSKPSNDVVQLIRKFGELTQLKSSNIEDEFKELKPLLQNTSIIICDGYHFDEKYHRFLKSEGQKLVVIDDLCNQHSVADLLINHGGELLRNSYSTEPYTRLLLGFDYLLIRPEFIQAARERRIVQKVDTAFICMGGSDPNYVTKKILSASLKAGFLKQIIVVTGSAFSYFDDLMQFVTHSSQEHAVRLIKNVDAGAMVSLMSEADICIVPASSVALEACCVKVGLLTGITFENQKAIHDQLIDANCALSLGDFNLTTEEEITISLSRLNSIEIINKLVKNQGWAVDGKSPLRIFKEFKSVVGDA